ncbi:type II toxin-antitoxin system death-on-curing family toxin [Hirschia litorea]|uniref:Type II toxin-antitoxin system death-on-curing family toxin n=1 Tax=Hirschia litorea TaxID=1199156 RepID=A0ABW2IP94_9PROT
MSHDYLNLEDILDIHHVQIERYGGSFGIRDQAGLEAAIARPQSGYYDGLISEAAAFWESMSQNHPFIDGNKRTAFMSLDLFLGLNGKTITARPNEIISFIYARFDQKQMDFAHLKPWLEANTQKF